MLIVEKETIFDRLLQEKFCQKLGKGILVTAKGYPDLATK